MNELSERIVFLTNAEMKKRLEEQAKKEMRSQGSICRAALQHYFDHWLQEGDSAFRPIPRGESDADYLEVSA